MTYVDGKFNTKQQKIKNLVAASYKIIIRSTFKTSNAM